MKNTYRLTAETMVAKEGMEESLRVARHYAKRSPTSREFWGYVVVNLEQMEKAERELVAEERDFAGGDCRDPQAL